MADRRPDAEDQYRAKRQKTSSSTDMDPKANPYLAHMYEEPSSEGYSNGYGSPKNRLNGSQHNSALAKFQRHNTTSEMAKKAEDGPNHAFNGKPLSKQYFGILKTRRGLPVHAQRFVRARSTESSFTNATLGMNSWRCIRSLRSWSSWERLVLARQHKFPNSYSSTTSHIFNTNLLRVHNLGE